MVIVFPATPSSIQNMIKSTGSDIWNSGSLTNTRLTEYLERSFEYVGDLGYAASATVDAIRRRDGDDIRRTGSDSDVGPALGFT